MASLKGTYIELDCIYDTRLPLLSLLSPDISLYLYTSREYFKRVKDNMGIISSDIFIPLYKQRNKKIFDLALPTPLLDEVVLKQYYELMNDPSMLETFKNHIYYVNCYPYSFNSNEYDILLKTLKVMFRTDSVKLINIPLKQVTTDWVCKHVDLIYMYDGLNWLEYHTANGDIDINPLVGIPLIVPSIAYGMENSTNITNSYLNKVANTYKPIIDLYFLDTYLFCTKLIKEEKSESHSKSM